MIKKWLYRIADMGCKIMSVCIIVTIFALGVGITGYAVRFAISAFK